ncbi:hypothetical protein PNOK_0401600 [Pyrrhoderma noxium]|uniref:Uncharacterized protein n=1 Tax=Pyrrhoderma noxium TaxID=2282107 RepID=A0A286UPC4_9AGAM|nr:hypothetical protein PNOK_0401600 [Pyrrhoderma noxium]
MYGRSKRDSESGTRVCKKILNRRAASETSAIVVFRYSSQQGCSNILQVLYEEAAVRGYSKDERRMFLSRCMAT